MWLFDRLSNDVEKMKRKVVIFSRSTALFRLVKTVEIL